MLTRILSVILASVGVFMRRLLPFLAPALLLACGLNVGRAQMANDAYVTKYFLDQPPSAAETSKLRMGARDVIVAKVHIIGSILSFGGRDQGGLPPPPPKYFFGAELQVVDVLRGKTANGARYEVSFGPSGIGRKYMYPHTPRMRARDYFVILYLDEDGMQCLFGFPAPREEYEEWDSEVLEYERARGRPGVRQE